MSRDELKAKLKAKLTDLKSSRTSSKEFKPSDLPVKKLNPISKAPVKSKKKLEQKSKVLKEAKLASKLERRQKHEEKIREAKQSVTLSFGRFTCEEAKDTRIRQVAPGTRKKRIEKQIHDLKKSKKSLEDISKIEGVTAKVAKAKEIQLQNALKKAQGGKPVMTLAKLAKSKKEIERKKLKSKKFWEEKNLKVKEEKDQRIAKRNENIQKFKIDKAHLVK
jgi:Surfeit locus protein 6